MKVACSLRSWETQTLGFKVVNTESQAKLHPNPLQKTSTANKFILWTSFFLTKKCNLDSKNGPGNEILPQG